MDTLKMNKLLAQYTSWTRYIISRHLKNFATRIGHCDVIFDLGCGVDTPYKKLFDSNSYWGIDLYEPAHIKGDIQFLPFSSNTADAVICTEVLEHMPDPPFVLAEINRILISGGYMVLTLPLLWGEHDYVDFQRWTLTGIKRLVEMSGFEILFQYKRGGIFSSIGCMIAQIPAQVFSQPFRQQNAILKIFFILTFIITAPMPWLLSLLDRFDQQKKWVTGYNILCKKSN